MTQPGACVPVFTNKFERSKTHACGNTLPFPPRSRPCAAKTANLHKISVLDTSFLLSSAARDTFGPDGATARELFEFGDYFQGRSTCVSYCAEVPLAAD